MVDNMTDNELIEIAYEAEKMAYAPYSKFSVGAALLTDDGKVYTGCNVENSSFGASVCAERTAALKAVSEGNRRFKAVAIVSSSKEYTYPCGICRQFLSEFMKEDGKILLHDKDQGIKIHTLGELFPEAFIL